MRPNIPTVETGQVLGASTLNGYRRGIELLYGQSHAREVLPHALVIKEDVYQSTFQTVWTGWCEHYSDTVYYAFRIKTDYGNDVDRSWYYQLQIYDNTDTWVTILSDNGTDNTYQWINGTTDMSAATDMTVGTQYQWRMQLKFSAQEDAHTCFDMFGFGERGAVSGWTTPHTFTAATSAAVDLNGLRTDVLALYDALSLTYAGQSHEPETAMTPDVSSWQDYTQMAMRYKPTSIYCQVQGNMMAARTWYWRMKVQDQSGNEAVVYTSEAITGTSAFQTNAATVDLTTGDAATALSAAGITLTIGDWYKIIIQGARGVSDQTLILRHAVCYKVPQDSAFDASWASMTNVACSDTPALGVYNALSTNLTALYSGDEAVFYDVPAISQIENSVGQVLLHRARYLHYLNPNSATLFYGATTGQTYSLPNESTAGVASGEWITVDMEAIGVPYGLHYLADNVACAYESES
jgi:hypothetical protein